MMPATPNVIPIKKGRNLTLPPPKPLRQLEIFSRFLSLWKILDSVNLVEISTKSDILHL